MRRRILPLLLAVAMVLSMIPVSASAAEVGDGTAAGTYETAAAFLAQAKEGVITLSEDVTLTKAVDVTENLTINLAGHKITSAAKYTLWAEGGATLTIKGNDTENPGTVENTNTGGFALVAAPYENPGDAKLIVDGGAKVENVSTGGDAAIIGYKKADQTGNSEIELLDCEVTSAGPIGVTIRDGKLTVGAKEPEELTTTITVHGKKDGKDVGAIDVENSTVNFVDGTVTSDSYGIAVAGKSTVNVTGGSIKGTVGIGTNGSTTKPETVINVSGGTIEGADNGAGVYLPAGKLNVSSGTISGGAGVIVRGGSLEVGDDAVITATGKGTVEVGDSGHSVPAAGIVVDEAAGGYPTIDDVTVSDKADVTGGVAFTGEGGPRVDPLQGAQLDAEKSKYNEEGYFEIVIDQSNIGPSTSGSGSGDSGQDGFWVGIGIIAPMGYEEKGTLEFGKGASKEAALAAKLNPNQGNSKTNTAMDVLTGSNLGFAAWVDAGNAAFKTDGIWYVLKWSCEGMPTVTEIYHIKLGNVSLKDDEIVPVITEVGFKADATAATEAVKKAAESVGKTGEACMSNTMWVAFKLNSGAEIAAGKKVKVEFKRGENVVCEGELDTTAKTTGGYACFSFDNASQIEPGATLAEGEYTITVTCGNNKSVKTLGLYKVTFTAENGTIENNKDGFAMLEDVDSVAKPTVTPNPGYTTGTWDDGVTNEAAHTVTYKYTCAQAVTVTVAFDTNGGTPATVASETGKKAGETVTLPTVSKEGNTLKGWTCDQNDGCDTTPHSDTYTVPNTITAETGTITLTAVWKQDEVIDPETAVTVKFDLQGGTFKTGASFEEEMTKEAGSTFELPIPGDVELEGYTLIGWNVEETAPAEDEEDPSAGGDSVVAPAAEEEDPTDPDEEDDEEVTPDCEPGETYTLPAAGYTVTFTAVWEENEPEEEKIPFTVTYKLDAADAVWADETEGDKVENEEAHADGTATITLLGSDAAIREGYELTGWKDADDVTHELATESTLDLTGITENANVELTAVWTELVKINYTVTFKLGADDATWADGTTADKTVSGLFTYDGNATITLPAAPTREGYKLSGWDVDGAEKPVGETVSVTGITESKNNIVITAKWEEDTGDDIVPPPTPDEDPTFKDVPASSYFFNAVEWGVANKIVSGTSATTFSPDALATRAQFVSFLWRASGRPEPKTAVNPFTDVKESDYFYKAVLWAVENKIVSGTSATTFSPNGTCTRAQAVTFMWRHAGRPAATVSSSFTDVSAKEYYSTAVAWGAEKKYVAGTSATTFSPNSTCTRAQAVTFLYRYIA